MDILLQQSTQNIQQLAIIKTTSEIAKMKEAGRICAEILNILGEHIKPGVTTRQLDAIAADLIVNRYHAEIDRADLEGFVYTDQQAVFFSLNDVFARGMASDEPLKSGDILGIDLSVRKDGWCGDTAKMYIVGGDTSVLARNLLSVAYEAMWIGIKQIKAGVHLGTIAHAVESYVTSKGFSMVKFPGLSGHSIGQVHCEGLMVPFYGQPNTGHVLQKGMVITIEPFISTGSGEGVLLDTALRSVRMKDHALAAYWEHVVAVTDSGYEVLDLRPGESA